MSCGWFHTDNTNRNFQSSIGSRKQTFSVTTNRWRLCILDKPYTKRCLHFVLLHLHAWFVDSALKCRSQQVFTVSLFWKATAVRWDVLPWQPRWLIWLCIKPLQTRSKSREVKFLDCKLKWEMGWSDYYFPVMRSVPPPPTTQKEKLIKVIK